MPRKPTEKTCCVCLEKSLNLNKLSYKDESKINLQTKLRACVSEIKWLSSYHICESCTKLLNIVHSFRETCFKSDLIRKQKTEEPKNEEKEEAIESEEDTVEGAEEQVPLSGNVKNETAGNDNQEDDQDYDPSFEYDYADDEAGYAAYLEELEDELETEDIKYAKKSKRNMCFTCQKCGDTFNSSSKLTEHCTNDHQMSIEDVKEFLSEDIEYEKKRRKSRKNIRFTCQKCGDVFNSSNKLTEHCINDHQMDIKDVRPFVCERCPRSFCKSSNLQQHIKYHNAVRSNICTYCGKGFITKTDLNIHEKQHLNRREYRCEDCGKCFNTHKDIRSHKLVVHTDSSNWKYCCKICNKRFPIKSNYDSHMRRHTGDKNFECHLCNRKFTDKCVLQRHMRTHSNVREHKCLHCDKEYKDHRVMRVHMAKIHGVGVGEIKLPSKERKYICHICPKAYYARNKLTRHLYTHSGEKPYDCYICGKKFNDRSYVKQHMRKTHNLEEVPSEFKDIKLDENGLT